MKHRMSKKRTERKNQRKKYLKLKNWPKLKPNSCGTTEFDTYTEDGTNGRINRNTDRQKERTNEKEKERISRKADRKRERK